MAIAVMSATAAGGRLPTDHALIELACAGLKSASFVRWKIMTLDLRIMPRRIGTLGKDDREVLANELAVILPTGTSEL